MLLIISILLSCIVQQTTGQSYSCLDVSNGMPASWNDATRDATKSNLLTFDTITDDDEATITLTNTLSSGQLCTLFEITTSDPTLDNVYEYYIPVGRSYDGNNWERVAGKHSELSYDCSANDGTCSVTLPEVSTSKYYMAAYKYELTGKQSWIRFMEKAAFGATPQAIIDQANQFDVSDMATYIETQLALTPTSHREYFRKRLNPRSLEVYKYGTTGPHACDSGSYWRNFAFTRKDKIMSIGYIKDTYPMMFHNVTLEQRVKNDGSGDTIWAWVYAGHVRTMMTSQPHYVDMTDYTQGGVIEEGTYDVCGVNEFAGSGISGGTDAENEVSLLCLYLVGRGLGGLTLTHILFFPSSSLA